MPTQMMFVVESDDVSLARARGAGGVLAAVAAMFRARGFRVLRVAARTAPSPRRRARGRFADLLARFTPPGARRRENDPRPNPGVPANPWT